MVTKLHSSAAHTLILSTFIFFFHSSSFSIFFFIFFIPIFSILLFLWSSFFWSIWSMTTKWYSLLFALTFPLFGGWEEKHFKRLLSNEERLREKERKQRIGEEEKEKERTKLRKKNGDEEWRVTGRRQMSSTMIRHQFLYISVSVRFFLDFFQRRHSFIGSGQQERKKIEREREREREWEEEDGERKKWCYISLTCDSKWTKFSRLWNLKKYECFPL